MDFQIFGRFILGLGLVVFLAGFATTEFCYREISLLDAERTAIETKYSEPLQSETPPAYYAEIRENGETTTAREKYEVVGFITALTGAAVAFLGFACFSSARGSPRAIGSARTKRAGMQG